MSDAPASSHPMTVSHVLSRYDAEVRGWTGTPAPGFRVERAGPVVRMVGPGPEAHGNAVLHADLDGFDADAVLADQVAFFGSLEHAFEWKHYGHDRPADLPRRLRAAGFVAQARETFVTLDTGVDLRATPFPRPSASSVSPIRPPFRRSRPSTARSMAIRTMRPGSWRRSFRRSGRIPTASTSMPPSSGTFRSASAGCVIRPGRRSAASGAARPCPNGVAGASIPHSSPSGPHGRASAAAAGSRWIAAP
jgi:hypothetical protein